MATVEAKLVELFERIQRERMADVPVLNPKLQVEAVGFRPWGDYLLGILISPWFMNLMLLPNDESIPPLLPGHKQLHSLPAGDYEFIGGEEPDIGHYQVCSLYSPMFDFSGQEIARETAEEIMKVIMQPPESAANEDNAQAAAAQATPLQQKMKQPVSRREFLLRLRGGSEK